MNRLQRRKMRLVLLRMILREQALGMRTWRQEAMKRTEVRRKMRRVLGRMVHCLVSAALGAWSNVVDYDRASELAVHRVISRLQMRAIAQAWRA